MCSRNEQYSRYKGEVENLSYCNINVTIQCPLCQKGRLCLQSCILEELGRWDVNIGLNPLDLLYIGGGTGGMGGTLFLHASSTIGLTIGVGGPSHIVALQTADLTRPTPPPPPPPTSNS